ncbi:MAG: hypothetical protein PUA93_03670 [Eubacteriales bacterium]|nr:hypothetical protein [Eubacteriales bacterium]
MKKSKFGLLLLSALSLMAFSFQGNASVSFSSSRFVQATKEEDQSKAKEALDVLASDLNIDLSHVLTDIMLPFTSLYNASIRWTSSNESVVKIVTNKNDNGKVTSIVGKVTRPDADTTLTLTATAQIGEDKEGTSQRSFPLTAAKKSSKQASDLPLAMEEDFSSYRTGLDISNYYKWQMTSGEDMISEVIDKDSDASLHNVNDLPSAHVLKINSARQASDICYSRKIHITTANAPQGAAFEGYFLSMGETNGISFEFVTSTGSIVQTFRLRSDALAYDANGSLKDATSFAPKSGVWYKFRFVLRTKSGYGILKVFDFEQNKYIDLTLDAGDAYVNGGGVTSNISGDVLALRIRAKSGSKVGATYISDLKLDSVATLVEEKNPANPNRSKGIGEITGYEPVLYAYSGNTPSGLNPDFVVHNRFDSSVTLVKGTDYSVSEPTSVSTQEDGYTKTIYTYTFTLLGEDTETETLTQTVYFDEETDTGRIYNFRASYLKADKSNPSKARITLSGNLVRSDATLHYAVLKQGNPAPSANDLASDSLSSAITHGSLSLKDNPTFSFDTDLLSIHDEYDVYALTTNSNGNSSIVSSLSVSTVINVSTPEDVYQMGTNIDTAKSQFRLINDIDMSSFEWKENSSVNFTGSVDGQGYKITGLRINLTSSKVGIFNTLRGKIKNIVFEKAYVSGIEDVGILAGNVYNGADIENVKFLSCKVDQEASSTGGGGYFGMVAGRMRRGPVTVKNLVIDDAYISCPKYVGLLTGGIEDGDAGETYSFSQIQAQGHINTDGAAIGLIGRNRATTEIEDAYVSLAIDNGKKEAAVVAGHLKEGGKLHVKRLIGDLKVTQMTQPTYFNNFIGSFDANTCSYTAEDCYFVSEDYSDLADNLTPTTSTVNAGISISVPEDVDSRFWETNTFIRNFDTDLLWHYDEEKGTPSIQPRKKEDVVVTASMVSSYIAGIDLNKTLENHYCIYKAEEDMAYLSDSEKAKITDEEKTKLAKAKEAYEKAIADLDEVIGDSNL